MSGGVSAPVSGGGYGYGGSSGGYDDYGNPSRYHYVEEQPTDGLKMGLLVGGGVTTATAVGVGGHAIWARTHVPERQARVAAAQTGLEGAIAHEGAMREALAADQVHPAPGTSADDALGWARGRFDARAGYALTQEGTRRDLLVSRWGTPTRSAGEAATAAQLVADGNAGGIVRAGEWHIPVRFSTDLDPLEKSRQVAYTDTEYGYHHGPNPANGGKYEYHYGPHPVTKYRTEHYLDHFDRFRAERDGLSTAFTDDLDDLRYLGTRPEKAVEDAVEGVGAARNELDDATRSLGYATGKSGLVRNIAIGAAVVGAGAIAAGLLVNRD